MTINAADQVGNSYVPAAQYRSQVQRSGSTKCDPVLIDYGRTTLDISRKTESP